MEIKMTVSDIKSLVSKTDIEEYPQLSQRLYHDERKQVKNIACSLVKRYDKYTLEQKRLDTIKLVERDLHEKGFQYIVGIDEVGRGPLCGPVVSAAVILPADSRIPKINDSKKLSPQLRQELYEKITSEAVAWGVGSVDNDKIDEINILNAAKLSMKKAVETLCVKPNMLLIDAVKIASDIPQRAFIKGDENIYSIGAASIVAKVTRDAMMESFDELYPEYGFAANKGYGTFEHIEAIKKYGPCPIHRRSFLSSIAFSPAKNRNTGMKAEDYAVKYISESGAEILCRNYKRAGGEIDIIYMEGETLVFCEVKARSREDYGNPEEFVDNDKKEKLILTAKKYMFEKSLFCSARFDIIAVKVKNGEPDNIRRYKNAFTISSI